MEAAAGKDAADHLAAGYGLEDFRPVQLEADGEPSAVAAERPIETKEEERSKSSGPAVPSADPAMYTGILGRITTAAAPTTEADPVGIYTSLLAGVGVLIGPGPFVRVGNTRHPLLIWPLLLGRTGSGRKGEATGTAEVFLRRTRRPRFAETHGQRPVLGRGADRAHPRRGDADDEGGARTSASS